ncbi:MAG: group I truncated hemoglobin [Gemmataceae bacterium]
MRRATRWKMAFSACVAVLVLVGAALADDTDSANKAMDRGSLDESIHQSLREIIDHGADLYNKQGDWNGCYRLWEGTLMSLRPLMGNRTIRAWAKPADANNSAYMDALKGLQARLGDRPGLKDVIDASLTSARQAPQLHHRAFVLRVALDQIRAATKAAPAVEEREQKLPDAPKASKTLWDRLGGEAGVTKVVDDFVNLTAPDAKVDFFRRGKYKLTAEQVTKMKRELIEQISQASGGPLKYTGPDMKTVHKGMGITDAQFDAAAANLKKALEKNNVAAEDVKKVLNAVAGYRKEIVEPKKEKKADENKK